MKRIRASIYVPPRPIGHIKSVTHARWKRCSERGVLPTVRCERSRQSQPQQTKQTQLPPAEQCKQQARCMPNTIWKLEDNKRLGHPSPTRGTSQLRGRRRYVLNVRLERFYF